MPDQHNRALLGPADEMRVDAELYEVTAKPFESPLLRAMPAYRCHKTVHALQIEHVIPNPRGFELHFVDHGFAPEQVAEDWYLRHNPAPGMYLVVYADGYRSCSPAGAFEDGYRLIDNTARRRVIVESPYAGDIQTNVRYSRAAVRDAVLRGEAPIASHLLFTQDGILRDDVPAERKQGIDAGLAWLAGAEACVAYVDRGISAGMRVGIDAAKRAGVPVEYRELGSDWATAFKQAEHEHCGRRRVKTESAQVIAGILLGAAASLAMLILIRGAP